MTFLATAVGTAVERVDTPPAAPGWAVLLLLITLVSLACAWWWQHDDHREDLHAIREWEATRRALTPERHQR